VKTRSAAAASEVPTAIRFEYHRVVFDAIAAEALPRIAQAVEDVRQLRAHHWHNNVPVGEYKGEDAWIRSNAYLEVLERDIELIAQKHNHYFWLHLYRRVGLGLDPRLGELRDSRTLGLVRNIIEVAFLKYGLRDPTRMDIALGSSVHFEEVAGGILASQLRNRGLADLERVFKQSLERRWVLVEFGVDDYVDIFRLEALAYEYWRTTTWMRRIGKGCSLSVSTADVQIGTTTDLEWLIESYDKRTEQVRFETSTLGATFRKDSELKLPGLLADYNIAKLPWAKVCPWEEAADLQFTSNFYFGAIDLAAYYRAHIFAKEAFEKTKGFSLASFVAIVGAAAALELGSAAAASTPDLRLALWHHLYQRAYVVSEASTYLSSLVAVAKDLVRRGLGPEHVENVSVEAEAVVRYLSAPPGAAGRRGLWSLGPRYLFVPHGDAVIVDLQAAKLLLANAFVGVRFPQGDKGTTFEESFRAAAAARGLKLVPYRELDSGAGQKREVDAAIRCGETLFLCECRAMERPLDLEISRPRSLSSRVADMDSKLTQARTLAEFVRAFPVGRNYDLSWASTVEHVVVSPFVEWVGSRADAYWLDERTPRILHFEEAISYIERHGHVERPVQ
jgi:hypothetical protein